MPTWKPHALAKPHDDQIELRMGDRVIAIVDLADVPASTPGKVILANGFNWQRYRVLFDDGAEVGDLDHRTIEPIGRSAKRAAKRAAQRRVDDDFYGCPIVRKQIVDWYVEEDRIAEWADVGDPVYVS